MDSPNNCDVVRQLFHEYVPEVANGLIEIKGIARSTGKEVMVAVWSTDERINAVASCMGQRGIRVKTIMQSLSGEKIDIVLWSDSMKQFLMHCLNPAHIDDIHTEESARRAVIFTNFENKRLLNANDGLRLKLVSQLVGWDLQVETG